MATEVKQEGVSSFRELPYTLWWSNESEMTKDLTYMQVVSPNVVFGVSRLQGSASYGENYCNLEGSPFIYSTVRGAQVHTSAI